MEIRVDKVNAQIKGMLKQCDIVENNRELQMSNKLSVPAVDESSSECQC